MNDIIIRESKGKSIGLSFLSILMVAASIVVIAIGINNGIILHTIIGVVGTLFFTYAMVYILGRTSQTLSDSENNFIIKIDGNGITDFSNKSANGLVKWTEIKSVKVIRVFTQKFISIELHDEEAFYSRLEKHANRIRKTNEILRNAPINLSVQTAKMTPEELLEIIEMRLKVNRSDHKQK